MRLDPVLTKASRFARSRKYEAAIRTLEPEVNRYHGSFNYYYILGSSCLRSGDFGGALTYFRLAHETKSKDPLAILGLAVLYLRRGETQRAVDYYLDVLETNPQNRVAVRAMNIIRKQAGNEDFSDWLEAGKLPALYPPIPFTGFFAKEILGAFAVLLAVCLLTCGILIRLKVMANPFYPKGAREGAASLVLSREDRKAPLQTGGSYRYEFTRVQALDTYDRALNLFTSYRDEAARVNLNRIIESNASDSLKNRAQIIISYMEAPGFDTFKRGDNVEYRDVISDPLLYNGVHVIWRGMATNVVIADTESSFDFLVGYDTRQTLDGIVTVFFNHAISINPERAVEVLCRIIPTGEDAIQLEGVAIHQL